MPLPNLLAAHLPMDRRWALLKGQDLPPKTMGAVLFADIRGFAQPGEGLAQHMGPWRDHQETDTP